jgi:acetyl esterase/lipase
MHLRTQLRRLRRAIRLVRRLALGAAVLTVSACADAAVTPPVDSGSVLTREYVDVPYATIAQAQRLDLYLPATGAGPFPVIVWIHGGGWSAGSKTLDASSVQRLLTSRGYAVATVEYRLSGVARYPAAVNDVKAAIRFLRANSTRYALKSERLAVWGSSAGGHLAAMVALSAGSPTFDEITLGNAGVSSLPQALVDWFGPSELLQMDADGTAQGCVLFGGTGHDAVNSPEGVFLGAKPSSVVARAREASPVTWVSADDPPALIQHGALDCTVSIGQGRRLRDAMRAVMDTSRVQWTELPGAGHGGVGFESSTNMATVVAFLDRWLR